MTQSTYAYKVRDSEGKLIAGTLEADNQTLVASRLRQMGYIPVSIEAKSSGGMRKDISIPGFSNRVGLKEVALFSRQFATLISSGLTLIRSLGILISQTQNPTLAKIINEVREEVERGSALSLAMAKHPKAFGRLFVAMVRAGEAGGGLDQSLLTLANMLEKQAALRAKIKSAMAYPVVVLSLVLMIVAAMILFIVPVFKGIYASLHGTLPLPTRLLITVSGFAVKFFIPIILVIVAAVFAVRRWKKTPSGRAAWDTTMLKLPIFGQLLRKTAIARFCSTFSSLLTAGVPVLESLEITKETVNNVVVARAVDAMSDGVRRGEPLAGRLSEQPIFPPMVAQMMSVGEETGALDAMLGRAATFLDEEISRTVEALTSLLEPVMIVVLGSCVGTMVVCLYLPMFNVNKLVNPG